MYFTVCLCSGQDLTCIRTMTRVLTIKCFPREIHNSQSPEPLPLFAVPELPSVPKILPLRNLPQSEVSNPELKASNCSLLKSTLVVIPFHPSHVHNV